MKLLYIYRITNKLNGKKYIGKHSYINLSNSYYGSGVAIKKAINKHGKHNFSKDILCVCDNEKEWNEKEIFYIKEEGTFEIGYNMTKGGEGMLGFKPSAYSKEKSSKGRIEYYKNNPLARLKLKENARKRFGSKNPFFGKKLSKEHIDKMRTARIKAITGSKNKSSVRILCVEQNIVFETAKDAALFCNLSHSTTILKCAKGQLKTAGGFTWKILNKTK